MPVRIICPHCGQDLRLPDRLYKKAAQCPLCEGAFKVRWGKARPLEVLLSDERKPCRYCGEPIDASLPRCPVCREDLTRV
jgi:hypothetical protein